MNKKPPIKSILEILKMRQEASQLYEESDNRLHQILEEFGEGRFDYNLCEMPEGIDAWDYREATIILRFIQELMNGGQYLKFEVFDNARLLTEGKTIYKSTSIKPASCASRSLKRCPDSLK